MNPFTSARHTTPDTSKLSAESPSARPDRLPWQLSSEAEATPQADPARSEHPSRNVRHTHPAYIIQKDDPRVIAMERDEPKRQLIRDAEALGKFLKITQGQMAEVNGVPRRTLKEWLQFWRMPEAPGTTLIRRWVDANRSHITGCR